MSGCLTSGLVELELQHVAHKVPEQGKDKSVSKNSRHEISAEKNSGSKTFPY